MNSNGAQDWRAIALVSTGGERLLCLGESSSQVRAAYAGAWTEVIRDEDRPSVSTISLQKWVGKVWQGQWEHQTELPVPSGRIARISSEEADEEDEDDLTVEEEIIVEAEDVPGEEEVN